MVGICCRATGCFVENADEATIYVSIATNFNNYRDVSGDCAASCERISCCRLAKTFAEMKRPMSTVIVRRSKHRRCISVRTSTPMSLPMSVSHGSSSRVMPIWGDLLQIRSLSVVVQFAAGGPAATPANLNDKPSVVGQQIYHQHQSRNELLAG